MPDVSSTAPAVMTTWVAIDQHKLSLVAEILPGVVGPKPRLTMLQLDGRWESPRQWPGGLEVCRKKASPFLQALETTPSWERR